MTELVEAMRSTALQEPPEWVENLITEKLKQLKKEKA